MHYEHGFPGRLNQLGALHLHHWGGGQLGGDRRIPQGGLWLEGSTEEGCREEEARLGGQLPLHRLEAGRRVKSLKTNHNTGVRLS